MNLDSAFSPGTQRVAKSIWRCVAHYFYGMFATSFNSGITSMDAFIGLAVGASQDSTIQRPTAIAALYIFGTSFMRSCLMYFKDNKLPAKLPVDLGGTGSPFSSLPESKTSTP